MNPLLALQHAQLRNVRSVLSANSRHKLESTADLHSENNDAFLVTSFFWFIKKIHQTAKKNMQKLTKWSDEQVYD